VTKGLSGALILLWLVTPCFGSDSRMLAAAIERAISEGQNEKARQALEELLTEPHVELDVLLATGIKLAEREYYGPAADVFGRAVKDYPQSFEARYNLALADLALRKFTEAQTALEGLDRLSRDQQLAREYLRGKIYFALGQNDKAERGLAAAFAGAPQQENYALDLGLFYLRRQLYRKAVATLDTGVKHHPDSIYLTLGLALAQLFGDDPPKAIATCRKTLAMDPAFGPARLLLVVAFYMNGENENCVKETGAALSRPGAPPYLYYLHAASLLKLNSKDYPMMLRDLDTASRSIPGCAFCYFEQSKVHQEMGQDTAAIADLEMLVERIDPEFAQGWYRLSNLYQHAGRANDASRALARFRAIKTAQTDRDTEYLRKLFLSALEGEQTNP
jgi:tetratricopeptide (TPR) repeat protein